jgi:hypothetical protein
MLRRYTLLFLFFTVTIQAQYTDQINSNRPGASIGAFAVGKGIIQFEGGFEYRKHKHQAYNNSTVDGSIIFLAARWGFLSERLELTYQGSYMFDKLTNKIASQDFVYKRKGLLQNFLGIKFLIYDPFKKEEKVNVYSWKANNGFKLKHLIPAVSITAGGNFIFGKNHPYPFGDVFDVLNRPIFFQNLNGSTDKEPFFSLRSVLATQSHFLGSWVFVTNFIFDRYLTEQTAKSYILTLTHTFHPLWSVYLENEGLFSGRINDQVYRTGAAYLFSDNIQIEGSLGVNTNTRPSALFVNLGVSYRLNFHKDFISAAEIEYKESKKEEKKLKKTMKKNNKAERKRARKAKRI